MGELAAPAACRFTGAGRAYAGWAGGSGQRYHELLAFVFILLAIDVWNWLKPCAEVTIKHDFMQTAGVSWGGNFGLAVWPC